MRFDDGRIDQFVSSDKTISEQEKKNLIWEYTQRCRGMATVVYKYFKNELKGDDSEEIFTEDEQRAFMTRAQDLAQNGYQDAAGSKGGKKPPRYRGGFFLFLSLLSPCPLLSIFQNVTRLAVKRIADRFKCRETDRRDLAVLHFREIDIRHADLLR